MKEYMKHFFKSSEDFIESQRKVMRWSVPDWKLEAYIARGAYGHTFLGRGIADMIKVIKIYEPSPDAIDDLKKVYGLKDKDDQEELLEKLREVLGHDALSPFWRALSNEEKRHILLPQTFISNVRSKDGIVTYASTNEVLDATLDGELREGTYDSYEEFLPLMRDILEALKVVHQERGVEDAWKPMEFEAEDIVKLYDERGIYPPPMLPGPSTHRIKMSHNDIKASNIGFNHKGELKLFDFGIATTFSSNHEYDNIGSLMMRAPELESIGEKPNPGSDVWQIGCLFFDILTNKKPFESRNSIFDYTSKPPKGTEKREEFERTRAGKMEKDLPLAMAHLEKINTPSSLVNIVDGCLQIDPEKRYKDAHEVLNEFNHVANEVKVKYFYHRTNPDLDTLEDELKEKYNAYLSEDKKFIGISVNSSELDTLFGRIASYFERRHPPPESLFISHNSWPSYQEPNLGTGFRELTFEEYPSKLDLEDKLMAVAADVKDITSMKSLIEFAKLREMIEVYHAANAELKRMKNEDDNFYINMTLRDRREEYKKQFREFLLFLDKPKNVSAEPGCMYSSIGGGDIRFRLGVIKETMDILERRKEHDLRITIGNDFTLGNPLSEHSLYNLNLRTNSLFYVLVHGDIDPAMTAGIELMKYIEDFRG
ncbi:protein kinase [Candidatus Woesearchaeota archaeon]|nr:protein kinase [Candidatus Woesearchaeota archaeon]